jgi:hypothetical protein
MSKCFKNKESVLLLLEQLSELIDTVQKDAGKGTRINQQTIFNLYISPVDMANNIILIQNNDKFSCDIRLFTASSLFTGDEYFCSNIHKEISSLISNSMLVSARLKQERCLFFKNMQNKINGLKTEIEELTDL